MKTEEIKATGRQKEKKAFSQNFSIEIKNTKALI